MSSLVLISVCVQCDPLAAVCSELQSGANLTICSTETGGRHAAGEIPLAMLAPGMSRLDLGNGFGAHAVDLWMACSQRLCRDRRFELEGAASALELDVAREALPP